MKKIIAGKKCAMGTFIKGTDPANVEILALAGFDFFVLDNEHVAMDRDQLIHILRAAEAFGIEPIVRVKENQRVELLQNLDLGYMGVQVPNVDTPEEAEALVQSVKYGPRGIRGVSPSVRACCYGSCGVKEYIQKSNDNTFIAAHCETQTCVDNLDEILKIDGIDVIFIGPMDLSQSLGKVGEMSDPLVKETIAGVMEKVKKSDKAIGTVAGTAEAAKTLIEQGVRYILLGSDQGMMYRWGKEALEKIRETNDGKE